MTTQKECKWPDGPVTPAIYSTIAIAQTISSIVIVIVEPIASVNVPIQYSTTHYSTMSSRSRNS